MIAAVEAAALSWVEIAIVCVPFLSVYVAGVLWGMRVRRLRVEREQAAERAERRARRLAAEDRARRTPQVNWAHELQLARESRNRRSA